MSKMRVRWIGKLPRNSSVFRCLDPAGSPCGDNINVATMLSQHRVTAGEHLYEMSVLY